MAQDPRLHAGSSPTGPGAGRGHGSPTATATTRPFEKLSLVDGSERVELILFAAPDHKQ